MVNKKLAEWIKSEEAQGYSEQQLRDYLLKQRYNPKQVEDAIKLARPRRLKQFIKPTPLKLFFPVLVFLLIVISFFVNSIYVPKLGERVCNVVTLAQEKPKVSSQQRFDVDPEEIIQELELEFSNMEKEISEQYAIMNILRPLILGNMYFYPPRIYKFNPFFPVACEWYSIEQSMDPAPRCSYYISQEDYNCIKSAHNKIDESAAGLTSIFQMLDSPYQRISLIGLIFNALLLSIVIYLIVSIPSFLLSFLHIKGSIIKKILYILAAILILLLIAGVFVGNHIINNNLIRTPNYKEYQYKAIYCNNTMNATAEEIGMNPSEIPIGITPKICFNPGCGAICGDYCKTIGIDDGAMQLTHIPGNNPFCVCTC